MCRNHRGFVDAIFACAKLGASVLLLNTDFARPQLLGVIEREQPQAVIYDAEFENLLEGAEGEDPELTRIVSWVDDGYDGDRLVAEDAIARNSDAPLDPPEEPSRFVILTSGTTGTPKGAQRGSPDSLAPLAILLSKIPMRAERRTVIAAPLFHSWGFLNFAFGLALGSTLRAPAPLRPRGDAEDGRRQRRRRARRRPGDAAADHGARPGGPRPLRPAEPADHRGQRLGAARRPGDALDGQLRRQPLQLLRLDRGRLGDDRDARGHARGARHRRAGRRTGPRSRSSTRTASELPRGRDRPDLRRQRDVLRGLHRRRRQGRRRRDALLRRRRPLRRATAACSSTAATTR